MASINSIRYRSYYYDSEIGMYYLQSRYYDPSLRRFINEDSIDYLGTNGTNLSFNIFAYCENNAVNAIDLTGNAAIYIIDYNNKTGLPVLGHCVLLFQDEWNRWWETEFSGTKPSNAKIYLDKLDKKEYNRLFKNIIKHPSGVYWSNTACLYLPGDFSALYSKIIFSFKYYSRYNAVTNNCAHYLVKLMKLVSGKLDKKLSKAINGWFFPCTTPVTVWNKLVSVPCTRIISKKPNFISDGKMTLIW